MTEAEQPADNRCARMTVKRKKPKKRQEDEESTSKSDFPAKIEDATPAEIAQAIFAATDLPPKAVPQRGGRSN